MTPRVLVVESDRALRSDLERAVRAAGYAVETVAGEEDALARTATRDFDVVLLELPEAEEQRVGRIAQAAPQAELIAMGSTPSVERAVGAMRRGARDFLRKPFTLRALETALARTASGLPHPAAETPILTGDAGMQQLLRRAELAAASDATIQIVGESGTGRDLLARFVHSRSPRRGGPYVVVGCPGLPENRIDAEVFGCELTNDHGSGARAAAGGTLVLDDVDEASPALQARLLQLLHDEGFRPVGGSRWLRTDARILVTSSRVLGAPANGGRLRPELQHRLDVIRLQLPALRDRAGDIPLLARAFLDRFASAAGQKPPRLTPRALAALERHPFRGNVRELENLMQRAVLLFPEGEIDADLLLRRPATTRSTSPASDTLNLRQLERGAIARSLERCGGNRTHAARALGISVRTLRNKIRRYGL